MSETPISGSRPTGPNDAGEWQDLLDQLVAVRGVEAAAIVGVNGEFLQGKAFDDSLLERMVSTVTSAMAAGEALAGLLEPAVALSSAVARDAEHGDAGGDAPAPVAGQLAAGATDDGDAAGVAEVNDANSAPHQLMVMYQDGGPILFTPLATGECVAVVALGSSHDIGRVRFRLRGLVAAGG